MTQKQQNSFLKKHKIRPFSCQMDRVVYLYSNCNETNITRTTALKKIYMYTDFPWIKKPIERFENVYRFNRGGGAFASHAEGLVLES